MTLRAIAYCTAVVLCSLSSPGLGPLSAGPCDGARCQNAAAPKPLNLMKFMGGNDHAARATTTRKSGTRHSHVAKARDRHHTVTARTETVEPAAPSPSPAAAPVATPESDPQVQVVSGDEFNEIDRAAGPGPEQTVPEQATARLPSTETNGAATAPSDRAAPPDRTAQLAAAKSLDDASQTTGQATMPPAADRAADGDRTDSPTASWIVRVWSSWSFWIWSSLQSAFTAVQQLFG